VVGNGQPHIAVPRGDVEYGLGEHLAGVCPEGFIPTGHLLVAGYLISIGAGDVKLSVLYPQLVDQRTGGCVKVALLQGGSDSPVRQFVGFDHGEATAGMGKLVVIVTGYRIDPAAIAEQVVVDPGVVIFVATGQTAVVDDLQGVHTVVVHVLGIAFPGPGGVVVGDKKALLSGGFHHFSQTFAGVNPLVVRKAFVETHFAPMGFCVAAHVLAAVIAGLDQVVLFQSNQVKVAGFAVGTVRALDFVHIQLHAVQREEVFFLQLRVWNQNMMVGISHDAISVGHIVFLDLLGGHSAIGNGGVAMHIRFVKTAGLGKQITSHRKHSFIAVLICHYNRKKLGMQDSRRKIVELCCVEKLWNHAKMYRLSFWND